MAIPKPLMINFVQQSTWNCNKCSTQNAGVMVVVVEEPHTQLAKDITSGISSKNFILLW